MILSVREIDEFWRYFDEDQATRKRAADSFATCRCIEGQLAHRISREECDPPVLAAFRQLTVAGQCTCTCALLESAGFIPTTENPMPVLKSLSFTSLPKSANDPVLIRRAKFAAKLEEQKLLLDDPAYIRTVQRTALVDGQKQPTVLKQRVRPWWKTDPSGQIVMSVKFGSKPIEFEKGGVVVPSKDKLPVVIDTLIQAVRAGELDDILAQASKARPVPKPKRAA